MSEIVYERIKNNLETLGMKNTLTILDNYLEQAIHEKKNIVDVLDYILVEEARSKNQEQSRIKSKCPVSLIKRH